MQDKKDKSTTTAAAEFRALYQRASESLESPSTLLLQLQNAERREALDAIKARIMREIAERERK